MPATKPAKSIETLTDEGWWGTCEIHDEGEENEDSRVWATSSGFNVCAACIRIHKLQPVCPWSRAIVKIPDEFKE